MLFVAASVAMPHAMPHAAQFFSETLGPNAIDFMKVVASHVRRHVAHFFSEPPGLKAIDCVTAFCGHVVCKVARFVPEPLGRKQSTSPVPPSRFLSVRQQAFNLMRTMRVSASVGGLFFFNDRGFDHFGGFVFIPPPRRFK